MATGNPKTKWRNHILEEKSAKSAGLDIALSYEGKAPEEEILTLTPVETMCCWSGSSDGKNQLFFGDNLPILATLLQREDIRGKIRLIYIDPPFATNSVFHSRSQKDAYQDLLVGSHYLEFLRKRLVFLRELLSEDGSIYVHLDDNMAFYTKMIMDEIFGVKNFRNWIVRRKCSHKNYTKRTYGNISDYILFYTKSDNYVWNRSLEVWTPERAKKEYTYIEEETGRRYKKVPIHAPGERNGETGQPWRGMLPPPGKHWQYTPKTLDEMDSRGEIYWSPSGNPRRKIYLDESEGVPVQDIWLDFRDDRNQNVAITGYPTEKNPGLLERIVRASSNEGDIVLDCFSGSGTTLEVAHREGRYWIGIDNSMAAIEATVERLLVGRKRMGDYVKREDIASKNSNGSVQMSMLNVLEHNCQQDDFIPIKDFALYTAQDMQEEMRLLAKRIADKSAL